MNGLVVIVIDRHPDKVRVESVLAFRLRTSHQVPGVGNGTLFEVVAKREVAVHLEERAVTGGLAYLVDVESTNALLDARGARPWRLLLTKHVRDEWHHAGHREQQ